METTVIVRIVTLEDGEVALVISPRILDALKMNEHFIKSVLATYVGAIEEICDEVLGYEDDSAVH